MIQARNSLETSIAITAGREPIADRASVTPLTASETPVAAESRLTAKSAATPCAAERTSALKKCLLFIITARVMREKTASIIITEVLLNCIFIAPFITVYFEKSADMIIERL